MYRQRSSATNAPHSDQLLVSCLSPSVYTYIKLHFVFVQMANNQNLSEQQVTSALKLALSHDTAERTATQIVGPKSANRKNLANLLFKVNEMNESRDLFKVKEMNDTSRVCPNCGKIAYIGSKCGANYHMPSG